MASKSDSPKTPDYLGAALAQGQLGKESALSQTGLNRPNEVTPWGSRTWSRTPQNAGSGGTGNPNANPIIQPSQPGTDPFGGRIMSSTGGGSGSSAYAAGLATTNQPQAAQTSKFNISVGPNRVSTNPRGGTTAVSDPVRTRGSSTYNRPDGTLSSTHDPQGDAYKQLLAESNASIVNPGDWTSTTTLDPAQQAILDQSNEYKLLSGGLAQGGLQDFAAQGNINFTDPNVRKVNAQGPTLDRMGDPNVGLDQLNYNQNDFSAERTRVEDSMFQRNKRLLDPNFSQQEEAMRSRLANQGLAEGSQAYKTEVDNFARNRDTAYQDAADSAVLAGGQEQSRLLESLLSTRNQDLQSQLANFSADSQALNTNNSATSTEFSQGLQGQQANFGSDLQLMQSLLGARSQAFNESQALNSGNTIQAPQFGGFGGAAGSDPADIMGALNSSYGANLGNVNAQNANAASTNGAGASIISAALMAY